MGSKPATAPVGAVRRALGEIGQAAPAVRAPAARQGVSAAPPRPPLFRVPRPWGAVAACGAPLRGALSRAPAPAPPPRGV